MYITCYILGYWNVIYFTLNRLYTFTFSRLGNTHSDTYPKPRIAIIPRGHYEPGRFTSTTLTEYDMTLLNRNIIYPKVDGAPVWVSG